MPRKVSRAASIDNVGILRVSQAGGIVKIRDVIQRQMLLNCVSSFATPYNSRASVPCGSRIDSALSRTRIIFLDDRKGRKGVMSSGFSTPAPITLESRLRKGAWEAGNSSQRMNQRLSPNHSLTR